MPRLRRPRCRLRAQQLWPRLRSQRPGPIPRPLQPNLPDRQTPLVRINSHPPSTLPALKQVATRSSPDRRPRARL